MRHGSPRELGISAKIPKQFLLTPNFSHTPASRKFPFSILPVEERPFSAWVWVDEATWPWTASWVRNASTSTSPISAGRRSLEEEAPDPVDVGLLGADAVVQPADDVAHPIDQPGLAPSRGQIPRSVHPVFLYDGARAPLYNPLRHHGVASLAAAPAAI